jgi:hypothetical protein
MVQPLHQMVLQESVPVHGQLVQVLVVRQVAAQLIVLVLLQPAELELQVLVEPELLQPVEQLPLLSAQTLE